MTPDQFKQLIDQLHELATLVKGCGDVLNIIAIFNLLQMCNG